jgi:hypothetical protein
VHGWDTVNDAQNNSNSHRGHLQLDNNSQQIHDASFECTSQSKRHRQIKTLKHRDKYRWQYDKMTVQRVRHSDRSEENPNSVETIIRTGSGGPHFLEQIKRNTAYVTHMIKHVNGSMKQMILHLKQLPLFFTPPPRDWLPSRQVPKAKFSFIRVKNNTGRFSIPILSRESSILSTHRQEPRL